MAKYDVIGRSYADYRLPDPRIARRLHDALGTSESILNLGAGSGSYEPTFRSVVAVEPSATMIAQRSTDAAPVVQAVAEALPFADHSFAAGMGVLTLHHWHDPLRGLREALRVCRERVVLLSWVGYATRFWLFDYFPEIESIDAEIFPTPQWIESVTGARVEVQVVPVPADCKDGFLCAWWQRPEAYLDAGVRAAISTFAVLERVEERLQPLRRDLESGRWQEKYSELLEQQEMDYGYRLLTLVK